MRSRRTPRNPAWLLVALLCLTPLLPVHADDPRASSTVEVTALAVTQTSEGLHGVAAQVQATVLGGGTGQVFVTTKPLAATDMQGSARLAARVAANLLGADMGAFDYLVGFHSGSTVIGGPSAGAVMTLALATALHNVLHPDDPWALDPRVAATGTINPDGTVGPVGGVPDKAEAARDNGVTLFLYPRGLETATTLVPGSFGLRQATVNMSSHCNGLGITCRPATHVADLVEAAAGVRLDLPPVPAPTTADYRAQLQDSVEAEVERLAARLDRLDATGTAALAEDQATRVRVEEDEARDRLNHARDDLDEGALYAAATHAFQGNIFAGRAENLTAFYGSDRSEAPVASAVQHCVDAAAAAQDVVAGRTIADLHALFALAAAQERVQDALALRDEAQQRYNGAFRFEDWVQAMFTASFCTERARTVAWWADLDDAFGPGPAVGDLSALVGDALDQARDLVAYADAVTQGGAAGAAQRLQQAEAWAQDAPAAALAAALQAQAQASVAVQTAAAEVPGDVLVAAHDGAARAIAQARARGVEPMLAVSLVELAQGQEGAEALTSLWTARNVALVGVDGASGPAPHVSRVPGGVTGGMPGGGYAESGLIAFLVIGMVLGACVVGVAWSLTRPRAP